MLLWVMSSDKDEIDKILEDESNYFVFVASYESPHESND